MLLLCRLQLIPQRPNLAILTLHSDIHLRLHTRYLFSDLLGFHLLLLELLRGLFKLFPRLNQLLLSLKELR